MQLEDSLHSCLVNITELGREVSIFIFPLFCNALKVNQVRIPVLQLHQDVKVVFVDLLPVLFDSMVRTSDKTSAYLLLFQQKYAYGWDGS